MIEEFEQSLDRHQIGTAKAAPTKNFFVNMLTRDIELQDALLDLLDNCVDGILRSIADKHIDNDKPYDGYETSITFEADQFVIEDNCGGIPIDVARKYAFSMGRPPDESEGQSKSIATVGMYGIGMKRAIFKLGMEASIESRNDTGFVVEFDAKWLGDPDWNDLPMFPLEHDKLTKPGTRISVSNLHSECRKAFSDKIWIDSFKTNVSRHYAIIISKGFSVKIGTKAEIAAGAAPIPGAEFRLLETDQGSDGTRVQPFIYFGTLDDVKVEIYAGIYRKLLTAEEAEREEQTRSLRDDAGWTVACNDRVVIWKDKTRLTGWGENTVPNYHGQFITITGLVLLNSDDPKKLPLTTTKRGIDASSNIYSEVKDLMREATKTLTGFTNKWKNHGEELGSIYKNSRYVDLPTLRERAHEVATSTLRRFSTIKRSVVNLPLPAKESSTERVSFMADTGEVKKIRVHFFEDQQATNSDVGKAAFAEVLRLIER